MKIKKLGTVPPLAVAALGVFLGRGAHAETIIIFDNSEPSNTAVSQTFGDGATASSDGVSVVGFGTPNIDLTWSGIGAGDTGWEHYDDSVWAAAGQLNDSAVGFSHQLTFKPTSADAQVVIKSFNFHPYYAFNQFNERFTYNVRVLSGTNVLNTTNLTFRSDATKDHPVSINYTGAPGQTLKLRLNRVASTLTGVEVEGDPYDIAVDDIRFAQLPETALPVGPQVVAVSPADDETGVAAIPLYTASITNGASTIVPGSIQLRLDGTLLSPVISSSGGLTNVSFQGTNLFAAGSIHSYALSYNDSLGDTYTNLVYFTVTAYPVLPASYALPSGAGVTRGFTFRTVAIYQDSTTMLASTVARAKSQLAGTLIDTNTSMPYTNSATPGTNSDGSFNIDAILNFSDDGLSAGNFPDDTLFPGLETPPNNWFSSEGLFFLNLEPGYYRLGVNSDDGFEVSVNPPQGVPGSSLVLGIFDTGRAAEDTLFDFLVVKGGIYPFRLVYFESTGSASVEFFSVDLATNEKILINQPTDENAIPSYLALKPLLTSISRTGTSVTVNWVYGTPPFQLEINTNLSTTNWVDIGSVTSNRTATVTSTSTMGFFRVVEE